MRTRTLVRRLAVVASTVLAGSAIALAGAAPAAAVPVRGSGCADIEAISVRGSTERQGNGGSIAGPLVSQVQTRSAQTVRTHDLVYPASLGNYTGSVRQGVSALQSRLRSTSAACPGTTFVLAGYSQGAQVIGNTLAATRTLPAADRIGAVVFFGDPSFNGSESYNVGSFQRGRDGIFPRARGALAPFAADIRSYCNRTDNFCQSGARGNGHYTYGSDRTSATSFVLGRIGG